MPGIYISGIQSNGEDLQKRPSFRPTQPRKAKRCDICYGVALGHIVNVGKHLEFSTPGFDLNMLKATPFWFPASFIHKSTHNFIAQNHLL